MLSDRLLKKRLGLVYTLAACLVLLTVVPGCKRAPAPADASAHGVNRVSTLKCIQTGIASWYGTHMKGHRTASGEKYDPEALTAASKRYPLGTKLNVINTDNDQNVTVTVNDRGPYANKRIIDMSVKAAHELGMEESGLAPVCVQSMKQANAQADSGKQQSP